MAESEGILLAKTKVDTIKLTDREKDAIQKCLREKPGLWEGMTDFIHDAIRDKLRKEMGEA